jgi:hypothetical protein
VIERGGGRAAVGSRGGECGARVPGVRADGGGRRGGWDRGRTCGGARASAGGEATGEEEFYVPSLFSTSFFLVVEITCGRFSGSLLSEESQASPAPGQASVASPKKVISPYRGGKW